MTTLTEFTAACRAEVGYREEPAGSNKTKFAALAGHTNGYAWCHTFLAGMARSTRLRVVPGVCETAYTPSGANAWKAAGRWHLDPRPGDWGYMDFPGDGVYRISHVGLVTAVHPNGTLSTIEGNTSAGAIGSQREGVWVAERKRNLSLFKGFGRPNYDAENPTPGATPKARRTLHLGIKGLDVAYWQKCLNLPERARDGDFGPQTEAKTQDFQRAAGLPDDGVVGPRTWTAMDHLLLWIQGR